MHTHLTTVIEAPFLNLLFLVSFMIKMPDDMVFLVVEQD